MTLQAFFFAVFGWLVGLPLEFLVISALFRGPYRRFPLVFAYMLATFVGTVVEVALYTDSFLTRNRDVWAHAARVYWVNDGIQQLLILATVISLIDQAISASPKRRVALLGMAVTALLFAGGSYLLHYMPPPAKVGYWMTPWTRDISVCATVLDVGLWMTLIASRKPDRTLLMISGALGMQFTGEAIGEVIRNLSMPNMAQAVSLTGSVVAMLADLICLYVWWQTFRGAAAAQ